MKLKTKLKKSEEGSVFELKINSEEYPEYNNKYIYLIKSSYIYEQEANYIYFYAIISDKKELEDLLNYNEEELVKTTFDTYETRFLPLNDEKDLSYRKKVKFYPDKYNYLWMNIFRIARIDDSYDEKLKYLGKIDFKRPPKEFIPFSEFSVDGYYGNFDLKLEDYLIDKKETYSENSEVFTKEGCKRAHYNSLILLLPLLDDYKKTFNLDDKFNVRD